jgi:hypothetical protein
MSTRTKAIAATMTACAALFALPVAAVDGEILIDQKHVNAGGITPGDDPGFPATLSKPGRYKLTGNLAVPAGKNGIQVTQNDVAIDLNGFTISGNPPGQAYEGVDASEVSRLRVLNGTITGFRDRAIDNFNGTSLVVENMRLISNGTGVWLGRESRIRNSTIANGGVGIDDCRRCLIEQNVIADNAGAGIRIGGGVVLGNVLVGNGIHGLVAHEVKMGYGNNILFRNNGGGAQVSGLVLQMHPNVCEPACP